MNSCTHELGVISMIPPSVEAPPGRRVLASLLNLGLVSVEALKRRATASESRLAGFGRIRGSRPGVSFRRLVDELESTMPLSLDYPFEGSERVGGAVWPPVDDPALASSNLAKLRWNAGADDLPMHVHEHSDRCIIVLDGRGFFHVSPAPLERFDGSDVLTVAARELDVFVFTRGVVHTFSTAEHAMTLLSCQLPFMPFDDPRQYTLPRHRWIAREQIDRARSRITMEWTYALVAGS